MPASIRGFSTCTRAESIQRRSTGPQAECDLSSIIHCNRRQSNHQWHKVQLDAIHYTLCGRWLCHRKIEQRVIDDARSIRLMSDKACGRRGILAVGHTEDRADGRRSRMDTPASPPCQLSLESVLDNPGHHRTHSVPMKQHHFHQRATAVANQHQSQMPTAAV